jgi:hypothetical protein
MPNEAPLALSGNVFSVESPTADAGFALLKLAPLPTHGPEPRGRTSR